MSDWSSELTLMRNSGATLEPGLSRLELAAAERAVGAEFPLDLVEVLGAALPIGKDFPNWREPSSEEISRWLDWPAKGIAFDIEHNDFWWPAWGERPSELAAAIVVARAQIALAPRLIPLFSHRYLPAMPRNAGNPVFSVHQTDVIYYGRDLSTYWQHESRKLTHVEATRPQPKFIRFWSELVEAN